MTRLVWAAVFVLLLGCPGALPQAADDAGTPSTLPACPALSAEFDATQCALVAAMALPPTLPIARGNAFADDLAAAEFGFYNFFDVGLSRGNRQHCATCHLPEFRFQNRNPVARAEGVGFRNTPTLLNVARLSVWFWDGSADSLWSQPLFAFESPIEMNTTRLELAHAIGSDARRKAGYERAFGALPELSNSARFPPIGKPGDAAFDGMTPADQLTINRVAANVGKAFEAYERRLVTGSSRFDAYLAGDAGALSETDRRGLSVFVSSGCLTCHGGPLATDEDFHDVGFPARAGAPTDSGRAGGVAVRDTNPFNLQGPYADPVGDRAPRAFGPAEPGAFRTPSLRTAPGTGPYGHNGVFLALTDVIAFHTPAGTSESDRAALIAFLLALEGTAPALPWSFWPSPPSRP